MRPCTQWQEKILALDPLNETDAAALEAHLRECPACRSCKATLSALAELAVADAPAPPSGFTDAVMASVRKTAGEKKKRQLRRRVARWASLAAVLAVAFLGARRLFPVRMTAEMAAPAAGETESFAVADTVAEAPAAPAPAAKYADNSLESAEVPAEGAVTEEEAADAGENGLRMFSVMADTAAAPASDEADSINNVVNNAVMRDDAAFLEETILPGSQPAAETPRRDHDYVLREGESVYLLWSADGQLYWQRDGEKDVFLSPAAPEALESYLNEE